MGLFRRAKKQAGLPAENIRKTDEYATRFRGAVPTTFPDGSPYDALESYDEITELAKQLMGSSHPDAQDLAIYCFKTLAGFASVGSPETYTTSAAAEALTAREIMLQAGMVGEERVLSRALLLILDYHEKAGHQPAMDPEQGTSS